MRVMKNRFLMFVLMLGLASSAAAASSPRSRYELPADRTSNSVKSPSSSTSASKIKSPVTRQIQTQDDGSSCSWLYYQCSWGISGDACTKLAICRVKNATGNGGVYAE